MLLHHVVDLLIGDLSSVLAESILDILFGDLSGAIDVKRVENGLQLFRGQELWDIHGRCNELTVVDLAVVGIVNLLDELVDLFWSQIQIRLLDGVAKFLVFKISAVIFVEILKCLLKIIDLFVVQMLNENVHGGLFQKRLSFEIL